MLFVITSYSIHYTKLYEFDGVTPEKFEKYLTLQAEHIKSSYKNNYMFIFAWNEWGEGGYLEPDEDNGFV